MRHCTYSQRTQFSLLPDVSPLPAISSLVVYQTVPSSVTGNLYVVEHYVSDHGMQPSAEYSRACGCAGTN